MPTTLQTKFLEDSQGNKYAPVTTPNAVRWSDGSNLNDHIDDGMKPQKLTIRLVPPEGTSASVLNGVPIQIIVQGSTGSDIHYKTILDTTWEGSDIELEVGTTYPTLVKMDAQFRNRYIPIVNDDAYITDNAYLLEIIPLFNNERTLEIEYVDVETAIATMYIDDTINSSYAKIAMSHMDRAIVQTIQNRFHRYLGKYDNGVLKMCQLLDYNSYYFHDGETNATTQGQLGDVFVTCESPIYTRYSVDTSLGHNRHKIEISFTGGTGWKEWHFGFGQDRDVLGAYNAAIIPDVDNPDLEEFDPTEWKPVSMSNMQPVWNISYSQWEAIFQHTPFRMVSWGEHNIIAVLLYALYETTNSYGVIGYATGDGSNPSYTGVYTDEGGVENSSAWGYHNSTNFLGLENWVGNVYEIIGNARCNVSQIDGVIRVTERDGTTRSISFPNPTREQEGYYIYSSYIFPKMQFGQNLDVVAATDAVDYDAYRYDWEAYNDVQMTGKDIPSELANFYINALVIRSGAFDVSPETSGVSFINIAPSIEVSSESPAFVPYVSTRMCFTGTTQLIEDPADYIALFNE